ncbi:unnamed protein product, partial [Ectocarpus sp. 12 AP-2014]
GQAEGLPSTGDYLQRRRGSSGAAAHVAEGPVRRSDVHRTSAGNEAHPTAASGRKISGSRPLYSVRRPFLLHGREFPAPPPSSRRKYCKESLCVRSYSIPPTPPFP